MQQFLVDEAVEVVTQIHHRDLCSALIDNCGKD